MFRSIFAKYISAFMSIIIISFLILMLIITGVVNGYVTDEKKESLANAAAGVASFLEARASTNDQTNFTAMISGEEADVDRLLSAFAASGDDLSILLVDTRGNVVRMIPAGGTAQASKATLPRDLMNEIGRGEELSEVDALEGVFDTPHYLYAQPVYTEDHYVCGTVLVCAESNMQDELLGVMLKTVLIGSLWIVLAALIALYFVTDRVIGPLKSMSRMAKDFAEGNFAARAPVRGRDEVARLAESFNNMADSLSRLEGMRNTFVANVSHDLRTPMTTISGFIDNILVGAIPKEKQPQYLAMIRDEVQRLARLVNSLLDLSRIQAGERKFVCRAFDVCETARRILISFENKIEEKELAVEFLCDEERILANADADAIYQVCYNLLDNAVKFSRPGGALRVSLSFVRDSHVAVSVYNEGEGIVAEDIPFVFDRFYKADKSRGLDKSGAGLGLFISKTIIDAHRERLWVKSEAGSYCEFTFTLPLAAD